MAYPKWTYPKVTSPRRAGILLESCPTCGAPPHAACISKTGRPVGEHGARNVRYYNNSVAADRDAEPFRPSDRAY